MTKLSSAISAAGLAKSSVEKDRNFRLVVDVRIIEVPTRDAFAVTQERTWHVEQTCVPLERVAALRVQEMVDHALESLIVIAGQDGE